MQHLPPSSVSYLTLLNALAFKHRRDLPCERDELVELVQDLLIRHWDVDPGSNEDWKVIQSMFPDIKDAS